MAIPPLVLRIVADSTGVKAGVASAQAQVNGFRGFMTRNSALIRTGALAGAAALAIGLKQSFDEAVEAREAQIKLANSIRNSADVSADAQARFNAQAEALRQLTAVDDEAINGAQAFLVQMGLQEEQVARLTPLVVDLSAKMGIDLETAAKAVGKSVNGTTGGLQRMGVVVDKTKAATDPYIATLDALGVAQGFAARKAEAQPWRKLGSELGELGEQIGKVLIPVVSFLVRILTDVVSWINTKFIPTMAKVVGWIRDKLVAAWQAIRGPVMAVINGIGAAVGFLADRVQDLIDAIKFVASLNPFGGPVGPLTEAGIGPRGPFRASGGPVTAMRPYIVGERGPELFIPRTGGHIVPNSAMGGVTVNIYGDVNDADQFGQKVERALNRAMARAG